MERSNKSKSFLREHELIGISNDADEDDTGFYFNKNTIQDTKAELDLEYYFQQREDSTKLLFNKKTLLRITHEKGMNRNIVVNALHLQDYPFSKIKKVIKDITKELKEARIKGILEFHANDTTQSSYHFHFWTWEHYEQRAREFLSIYMIENNYASASNVRIEGMYDKKIDRHTSNADKQVLKDENYKSKYNQEEILDLTSQTKPKGERINELRSRFKKVNSLKEIEEKSRKALFEDLTKKSTRLVNQFREKTQKLNYIPLLKQKNEELSPLEEINKRILEIKIRMSSLKK